VRFQRIATINLPGNQVDEKEAAVMLVTVRAIQLYQDPEFSVDTRVSINKKFKKPLMIL